MKKQTMGAMIASLRKEQGMTQLQLSEKMGVTDKAVSKWERDLSCPDVNSLPKLAEVLGVSLDELMQVKSESEQTDQTNSVKEIISTIFKAVPLAMGVAVVALAIMKKLDMNSALIMLGIGMACVGISLFDGKDKNE